MSITSLKFFACRGFKLQDKTVEAQSCLDKTIEIAQHQAKLLEFRGIMSR